MAKRVVEFVVDDLTGETLEVGQHQTVLFALDNVNYRIDLSADNASKLRAAVAPYIAAGQRVSKASTPLDKPKQGGRDQLSEVRQWARDNGYDVSARGRVPSAVLDAYRDAH